VKGDLDAALADFTKAIEVWADPARSGWELLRRGVVWMDKGEPEKALPDIALVLTHEPENDRAFYHMGNAFGLMEDFDQAIECFSKAIALKGSVAEYWLSRGICRWNKCDKDQLSIVGAGSGVFNQALGDYNKAIECAPDMANAYFRRGLVFYNKAQAFNGVIKSITKQKAADEAQRILLLAQLELTGGPDLVASADTLLRLSRSSQDQDELYMAKRAAVLSAEYAWEAIDDMSRVISIEPNHAKAYYYRGITYILLGHPDRALSNLEETCVLDPDNDKAAEERDRLLESLEETTRND
jgi:tetratricopeptide (TPR) repeat protein